MRQLTVYKKVAGIWDYIMNKRNPLAQFTYLMYAMWGNYVYWTVVVIKYCPGPYLPSYHKYLGSFVMAICYLSFFVASVSEPGVIRDSYRAKKLVKKYMHDYDDLCYSKNNICVTCNFVKPARSKHCKACDHCVEKFDHHCIWINNCVGKKNHIKFLYFLGIHTVMVIYGTIVGFIIFYNEMTRRNSTSGFQFYNKDTGKSIEITLMVHLQYFFFTIEE